MRATLTAYVNGSVALTSRRKSTLPCARLQRSEHTHPAPQLHFRKTGRAIIGTYIPCGFSRCTGNSTFRAASSRYCPVHRRNLRQASNIPHRGTATALAERPQTARKLPSPRQFPEPPQIRQMLEHGIETGGRDIPEVDTRVVQTVETALNHVSFAFRGSLSRQ
jgi:hypothetical protein